MKRLGETFRSVRHVASRCFFHGCVKGIIGWIFGLKRRCVPMEKVSKNMEAILPILRGAVDHDTRGSVQLMFPLKMDGTHVPKIYTIQQRMNDAVHDAPQILLSNVITNLKVQKKIGGGVQGSAFFAKPEVVGIDGNPVIVKFSHVPSPHDVVDDETTVDLLGEFEARAEKNMNSVLNTVVVRDAYADCILSFFVSYLLSEGVVWAAVPFYGCALITCRKNCQRYVQLDKKFKGSAVVPLQMLVTGFANGGTVEKFIPLAKPPEFHSFMTQLMFNLAVLQVSYDFCHNDLHPENVMLASCDAKYRYVRVVDARSKQTRFYKIPTYNRMPVLIDFGRSYAVLKTTRVSSSFYIDPFLLKDEAKKKCSFDGCHFKKQEGISCADGSEKYSDMVNLWYMYGDFLQASQTHGASPSQDDVSMREIRKTYKWMSDACTPTLSQRFADCNENFWNTAWKATLKHGGCRGTHLDAHHAFLSTAETYVCSKEEFDGFDERKYHLRA